MTPFTAEIIGTMLLILLGNGVVANVLLKDTKGNNSGWIVITTAWALAVFVGVTVAGPVSGAHLILPLQSGWQLPENSPGNQFLHI